VNVATTTTAIVMIQKKSSGFHLMRSMTIKWRRVLATVSEAMWPSPNRDGCKQFLFTVRKHGPSVGRAMTECKTSPRDLRA
jgi:hypothetical protein